jgi:hypothetical protein
MLAVESSWRWRLLAVHIEGITPDCGNSPILNVQIEAPHVGQKVADTDAANHRPR